MTKKLNKANNDELDIDSINLEIDKLEKEIAIILKWMKRLLPIMIMFGIIFTISTFTAFLKDNYTRNACIFIEQSIDILAPNLDRQEVLELKAQYRSINDANKFYSFEKRLKNIASQKGVQLPKFTIIK